MLIFKTERVKKEFYGEELDPRLRIILFAISGFVKWRYDKDVTINELFRTQQEQDFYYGVKADKVTIKRYKEKPWTSVHQDWRGADVDIDNFITDESKNIESIFNKCIEYRNDTLKYKTCKYHDVGLGNHIHVQVNYSRWTSLVK